MEFTQDQIQGLTPDESKEFSRIITLNNGNTSYFGAVAEPDGRSGLDGRDPDLHTGGVTVNNCRDRSPAGGNEWTYHDRKTWLAEFEAHWKNGSWTPGL